MPHAHTPVTASTPSVLPAAELFGRLLLAQVDVLQRLNFLASRLTVGMADGLLRQHLSRTDETFYAADQADLDAHLSIVMEAGGEGLVAILGAYIEELARAQIRCIEANVQAAGAARDVLKLPLLTTHSLPVLRLPKGLNEVE